jgi:hypothetical protein
VALPPPAPPWLARTVRFFRRHPVLLLLGLTPGIPEYLSGSTAVAGLVISPFGFLLFLGLNLGLYGPGVLLVREAHVRWKKGWSTVILLGGAYGLLEEGTALSTLFNPKASVVGGLGTYGHAYGVSWLWLIGILGVHIVYSVGLPILLLGLALPETRGQPFLTGYRWPLALLLYALDITILVFALHYWTGAVLLLIAAGVAGALWLVAWQLPAGLLDPSRLRPHRGPALFFVLGVGYFILLVLIPGLLGSAHLSAIVSGTADALVILGIYLVVWRDIGRSGNEPQLIALAVGTVVPLAVFGFFSQIYLPIVLVPDAIAGLFFLTLWRHYRPIAAPTPPSAGPVSGASP